MAGAASEVPLWSLLESGFKGGVWGGEPGEAEIDVACVRAADFDRVRLRAKAERLPMRSVTRSEWHRSRLQERSIVIEKSGGGERQPVGKAVLFDLTIDAVCSNFQASARVVADCDARYVVYLMESLYETRVQMPFVKQTTGLQNLDTNAYLTVRVPRPEQPIQIAIADYLDIETARIDELVAEKQRFIELLAERRAAVISAAFPTVGVPGSGAGGARAIRRLGEVSVSIGNGYVGPTRDILRDDGVRYLQSLHIKRNSIVFKPPYHVDPVWAEGKPSAKVRQGDLLIVQTGDIGQATVVPQDFDGVLCHALIIVRPNRQNIHPQYLGWYFMSAQGHKDLKSVQKGALHPHLNCGDVRDILVPTPDVQDQVQVVAYLDAETAAIDDLADATRQSIDLLKECRTALISAAVTGQIDVSSMATPGESA